MFRSTTIIRELALGVCALCVVQIETQSAQHTEHTHTHTHTLDITCCHTTAQSITMCPYRILL